MDLKQNKQLKITTIIVYFTIPKTNIKQLYF